MDGQELLNLTHARAFFIVDDYPGMMLMDKQGWLFERGLMNPRPIGLAEVLERGGTEVSADEVAELLTPAEQDWIKSA